MEANVEQKPKVMIMEVLKQTPPAQIAELDIVKSKFIQNYNYCHKGNVGELMYHRQMVHFKQSIAGSDQLKKADPFSLYACFITAAVNNYSLDPADSEVYLIPRGGKAYLERQAGAHVKRLMNSRQIISADQAKLVYKGDIFEVENGRVITHKERFESETITAGYIRFVLDSKQNDKYFIFRKSDWEAWKKKSPQAGGDNWSGGFEGQPGAAFLRTKIIKHAAIDKSWATGNKPVVEDYGVEIDSDDEIIETTNLTVNTAGAIEQPLNDDSFAESTVINTTGTVTHDDDDF